MTAPKKREHQLEPWAVAVVGGRTIKLQDVLDGVVQD